MDKVRRNNLIAVLAAGPFYQELEMQMPGTKPRIAMVLVFGTMTIGDTPKRPVMVTSLNRHHQITLWQRRIGDDEMPLTAATHCANSSMRRIIKGISNLPCVWQKRDLSLLGQVETPDHRLEVFQLRWNASDEFRIRARGRLLFLPLDAIWEEYGPIEHLTKLAFDELPEPALRHQAGLMDYPALPGT